MRNAYFMFTKFIACTIALCAINVAAQNSATATDASTKTETPAPQNAAEVKPNNSKQTAADKTPPAKKMVQDATITLQTTITGNQEQPRVLYILPWQSPSAANVDFESLDNEQKAVFGHVEREELRRELETSDEVK